MKKNFYRAFEDRYRGSRELIAGRLQFYRPFIEPLVAEFGRVSAIDLGCGRGEWLELMLSAGLDARGIDLDEGMLQSCVDLGLPAEKGEAIARLRALPSKSQAIVSAFHVVEHIPFDALEDLVSEAKRVLLPGGLLILETPNPENIMVATCSFYLDPTHQRPIPPNLLSFVAEYAGFERVKVIRLQESKELAAKPDLLLEDVLGGVSPDYSVVAQKKGKKSIMSALDQVFSQDYGLTLSGLSASYDAHMKGKAGEERLKLMQERFEAEKAALDSRLSTLTAERDSLATERDALAARHSTLASDHEALHQANHGHWQLAESLKQELAAKEQTWSEERSTLDSRLSTLTAECNELATRHQLLATERAALASRIEEVAGEAAVARAQSEGLRQELAAKEESLAAMRDTLSAERSTLVAERDELATRHQLLVTESEALSARIEEVAGEAAVAKAQSESLRQELTAKDEFLAAMRETLSAERSAAEARHQQLTSEKNYLDALFLTLSSENNALEREHKQVKIRVEEIAGEAAVARARSESLRQEQVAKEQAWSEERSTLSSDNSSLVTSNSSLSTERNALSSELHNVHQANHGHWQLAESLKQELAANEQARAEERSTLDTRFSTLVAERDELATEREALLASACWRITAPIRWARGGVRIPWPAPNEPLDDFFLKHAALYIRRRPHLKDRALQFLFRNPKWHARVLPVLQGIKASTASPIAFQAIPQPLQLPQPVPQPATLHEISPPQEPVAPVTAAPSASLETPIDLASLTPHARRIYADLKKAIEIKKGEVRA